MTVYQDTLNAALDSISIEMDMIEVATLIGSMDYDSMVRFYFEGFQVVIYRFNNGRYEALKYAAE